MHILHVNRELRGVRFTNKLRHVLRARLHVLERIVAGSLSLPCANVFSPVTRRFMVKAIKAAPAPVACRVHLVLLEVAEVRLLVPSTSRTTRAHAKRTNVLRFRHKYPCDLYTQRFPPPRRCLHPPDSTLTYIRSRACVNMRQAVQPDEFCEPLEQITIDGETLDLNPCGLIANSMFNGEGRREGATEEVCAPFGVDLSSQPES